jgi:hypothetical protein
MLWAIVLSFPNPCTAGNFTPALWSHVHPTKKVTARLYRSGQRASLTVTTAQDCTRNPGRVLTQLPETDQYQASTCRKRMRPCRRNGRSGEPRRRTLGPPSGNHFPKVCNEFSIVHQASELSGVRRVRRRSGIGSYTTRFVMSNMKNL